MLIDSHCHLDLLQDLDRVISQAKDKEVGKIISPCIDYQSCLRSLEIAKKYDNVFLAFGIHPEELDHNPDLNIEAEIQKINDLIKQSDKVVAIGECGLDFKFDDKYSQEQIENLKNKQIQLFKAHIELAKKHNLPIVIHNRRATDELLDLVINQNLIGVFHCFVGGKKTVKKVLELDNFYFGLGGIITFDVGNAIVAGIIPIDRIILETDSPYLTPMPVKLDKPWPNEPVNIYHTAVKLAQIKQLSLEQISEQTTNNVKALFKI